MKLFARYNRINLFATVLIFLLGCAAFAVLLRYVIISQVDDDLEIEKNEIVSYAGTHNSLPAIIEVRDQYIRYQKLTKPQLKKEKVYTAEVYNAPKEEKELQRITEFEIKVNDGWHLVTVAKSLKGTDELITTIILIAIALILLILLATFFINRFALRSLWKPFYETLQSMRQFNLSNTNALNLGATDIDEFKHLNSILSVSLNKAKQDYNTLKEFTENASHELQTPVAIIRSKLDNLIQDENLTAHQSQAAAEAYEAVNRLSKLNQSLLLLTKIENRQFSVTEKIDLKEKMTQKLKQFAELWQIKSITMESNLENTTIVINFDLIDVLLNNLLGNAIKYNIENGKIDVQLHKQSLSITNTGAERSLKADGLFVRFYKEIAGSESNGLGLSIVKQICDVSNCNIAYQFNKPNMHEFILTW